MIARFMSFCKPGVTLSHQLVGFMLRRCPYNGRVVCTIVELGEMTHQLGPYMRQDGYLPSLHCHTGISTPIGKSHRNAVHLAHTHLSKIHILSLPTHIFFVK